MGETAQLQGERPGQFGLNDFLGQLDNAATPQTIQRTILPVQEMRHFQRRFRFSSGSQTVQIGETFRVRFNVPRLEFWNVLGIYWENGDSVAHETEVNFSINRSNLGDLNNAVSAYRAALTSIPNGDSKVVYGVNQDKDTNNKFYSQFLDVILEPTDFVEVRVRVGMTSIAGQRWTLLYELVGRPSAARERGVAAERLVT